MSLTLSPLPPAPSRSQNPAAFVLSADAFLAALPVLVAEFSQLAIQVEKDAAAAENAASSASAVTSATGWVSGQSYARFAAVVSGINYQIYRKKTATSSSTTDPANDPTNWQLQNPLPASVTMYLHANFGGL